MNIEELFDNEKWIGYGMVVTDDANSAIDYLKTEVLEYVSELEKRIAELEAQQTPKVVTPLNGICPFCGGVCVDGTIVLTAAQN